MTSKIGFLPENINEKNKTKNRTNLLGEKGCFIEKTK